jgi:spore maturation protein CgeB
MRVLVVGPHWFGGWTESVSSALKQLNCQVEIFYYNKTATREAAKSITSLFHLSPTLFVRQIFWLLFMGREIDTNLIKLAIQFQPDLVLVLKGEVILPKTLIKLKKISSNPVLVNWWVDNPIFQDEKHKWLIFPYCVPQYDQLFVFDYAYFEPLRKLGAKKISFLPCAADPAQYHPEDLTALKHLSLQCNVCFIATFYRARGDLIAPFLNTPGLAIWGGGWSEFLENAGIKDIQKIVRGEYLPIEDVNRAYQTATIVINSHHPQTKQAGLNSRAFEIPASGGVQLTDYVSGMEELLIPGEEVVVYRSPDEGAALAKELINDPGTRNKIARAGHERVMSEHTYVHRMRAILDNI